MATPDYRNPDNDDEADKRYAPQAHSDASHSDSARQLSDREQGAAGDPTASNDPGEPSDNKKNIAGAKEKEEDANWATNWYKDDAGKKQKINIKSLLKKKGPLGLIIGMLLGGGGGLTFIFSPGMLIIDMKEKLTDAFNDQLAVMDPRTTALIKKKLNGTTSGFCTAKVSIRCKINTISDKPEVDGKRAGQLQQFEKNGIKVNKSGNTLIRGRAKVTSFEFEGKTIFANEFPRELRTNPAFRNAMFNSYNPELAGHSDSLFTRLSQKLGISKQKNITGNTKEEQKLALAEAAAGEAVPPDPDPKVSQEEVPCAEGEEDCTGNKTIYRDDVTGEPISKEVYDQRISTTEALMAEFEARKALTKTGGAIAKATIKGALTSTALGLGAVDTACTGYTLIRVVGFAAKYLGALQMLRFAHALNNTADTAKAGDGEAEAMEFFGTMLTTPNAQGDTATDSIGYHAAVYGDVQPMPRSDDIPVGNTTNINDVKLTEETKEQIAINDETTKYINGQLVSSSVLAGILRFVGAATTPEADATCAFVKSGWGQTILIGGAVVGAVAAFFSGGATLTWGVGTQIAAGVAFGIAIAMVTPKLIEMSTATMVTGDENGNQAGNMAVSGMGAYNDQTSSARGIPALEVEDAAAYEDHAQQTLAQYKELDRLNYHPLDATNPNTFMGSFVSKLLPYTTKVSSLGAGLSSITKLTTSSLAGIFPTTSAQDRTAKYKICEDADYKELNLAVDLFCNIKHGLKPELLEIDPETVLDYMEGHDYIEKDSEEGGAKDSDNEYAEYIKNCMNRATSLGGFTDDNPSKGEECIQGNASNNPSKIVDCKFEPDGSIRADDPCKRNCMTGNDKNDTECKRNMFRLFYVDLSIIDGIENGMPNSGPKASNENGTVVSPVTTSPTLSSGYGPRGPIASAPNASKWHAGIDINATPGTVVAAMAGEVVSISESGARTLTIKHADGLKTLYLHMEKDDVVVNVGDKVEAGQKLGVIGCAGKADGICGGPHLHFNIWIDEVADKSLYSKYKIAPEAAESGAGKAINPANFLTDSGVKGYEEAVNEN
jgi:biotin carboxyl carrier protein